MSDDQSKLQAMLNIASHYGRMYRVKYSAAKTKVKIHGPQIDQKFYSDIQPWSMDGERVQVVKENEHMGHIC